MVLSETSDGKLFKGDGGRLFEMVEQREIDSAVKKIKKALGISWETLRKDEELLVAGLKTALENAGRDEWASFRFSTLSAEEVGNIVAAEKAVAANEKSRAQASAEVLGILKQTTSRKTED